MSLIELSKLTPAQFPVAESDDFEFKSSLATPDDIRKELNHAASAFANSGGGCFIWGVADKTGDPDGGISPNIGRQNLREWIDQVIHTVDAAPNYQVQLYSDSEGRGSINADNVVVAVSVLPSAVTPHMASDKRYYIRAGAHTIPANHFIVEALWAARHQSKPRLSHTISHRGGVIQLGIVALMESPAVDVRLTIDPPPTLLSGSSFPLRIPVIDRSSPYYMDVGLDVDPKDMLPEESKLSVVYHDVAGNEYTHRNDAPLIAALPPIRFRYDDLHTIAQAVERIANSGGGFMVGGG